MQNPQSRVSRCGVFMAAALVIAAAAGSPPLAVAQEGPFQYPDDHFLCYKGKADKAVASVAGLGQNVHLADQFETGNVLLKKERGLCTPADKNEEGIVNETIHLTAYRISPTKGEPKHVRQTNVRVFNQFGELFLDTLKADRLLVPATKDLVSAPTEPALLSHNVDHYKCYKAKVSKGTAKFAKGLQVTISDQFDGSGRTFDVKKPKLLCNPVDKKGEGIKNAIGHQVCYQVKPAKGSAKHTSVVAFASDQIQSTVYTTKKEELLCVPSLKNPPDEFCGDQVTNQTGLEDCDGADLTACSTGEVCEDDCTACTLCGNGTIDGGENCELDSECLGTEFCDDCNCEPKPPLGSRDVTLGTASGFFSSFLPGLPLATPTGTLTLEAGPTDGNDEAVVTLTGPQYETSTVTLGAAQSVCQRWNSCTGTLYCSGGVNVDLDTIMDSLDDALSCVQDGTNGCPGGAGDVCCSNACEGYGAPHADNPLVFDAGVGASDSGSGAMLLSCDYQTINNNPVTTDCSTLTVNVCSACSGSSPTGLCCHAGDEARQVCNTNADCPTWSNAPMQTQVLTTGTAASVVVNHCVATGGGLATDEVVRLETLGQNFNCDDWTTTDGVGALSFGVPTEEITQLVPGDGANNYVYSDLDEAP